MLKIIEVKEMLCSSTLVDNIHEIKRIINTIINETEFVKELSKDDYDYLNIIFEKTRANLEKAHEIIKHK